MKSSKIQKKISVVTPSYNQGNFIEACIRSVLNQNYPNFEHIIIDNCSTDTTSGVLKKYPHLNCIVEADRGQCDAINKGIRAASGDWILWLNADDYMLEGAFEAFVKVVSKQNVANVVYGHVNFVDEFGNNIRKIYHLHYHRFMTFFGVYIPPSTGSFFRASLLKDNLLDEEFHYVMDTEWTLRCGHLINSAVINKPCSAFRVSDHNKTSQQIKNNIVVPKHAEERKKYYLLHIHPILKRFGPGERFIFKSGHVLSVMYYKLAKIVALIRYLIRGSI